MPVMRNTGHCRPRARGLSRAGGTLSKHVGGIIPSLRTATQGYAAKWQSRPDIRENFGTFEAYVASMTAKAKR